MDNEKITALIKDSISLTRGQAHFPHNRVHGVQLLGIETPKGWHWSDMVDDYDDSDYPEPVGQKLVFWDSHSGDQAQILHRKEMEASFKDYSKRWLVEILRLLEFSNEDIERLATKQDELQEAEKNCRKKTCWTSTEDVKLFFKSFL